MHPRLLALLVPVAMVVAACSGSPAPTGTFSASAGAPSPSPVLAAGPSATASTGIPGGDVLVTMTDAMRFEPGVMNVKAGERITFVVKNDGLIVHEFFVGTEVEQAGHAAEMAMGGMSHGHTNALRLEPGKTGTLSMTFATAGSLLVGCHEPGHYPAGMKAALTVVD